MRFAVLGNSHIGSIKRGWDIVSAQQPDHQMDFFGARRDGLKSLELDGNRLRPTDPDVLESIRFTSGGLDHIDLDAYDAFLLYGMEALPLFLDGRTFYSQQVMQATLADHVHPRVSYLTLKKLRDATSKPIYLGHNPMRGADQRNGVSQDISDYMRGIAFLNDALYGGFDAILLPQPPETIVNGRGSAMHYAQGAKALAIGTQRGGGDHVVTDLNHMNDAFGALWLEQFFARLH
ncbi:hypothetical protein ACFOKF_12070 [Sphingobium rhizovicinum]|uniref:Uncharacterized protein n=1 Tax=Sphingobium rhizovicinum TaxID=432308 RepID=A0ABV7NEI8_9SPHN